MNNVQAIELEIYKAVAEICEQNHLRYYADGGTLIGAVRHKGFIPWDDDIDLVMPRPDYDSFIRLARKELHPRYEISTYHGKAKSERPVFYCQVLDKSSVVEQNIANETIRTSIWIDIFPIDALPAPLLSRKIQQYRLLWNRFRVQVSNFDLNVHQNRANRSFIERAIISFVDKTKFGSWIDTATALAKTERIAKKYRYDEESVCIDVFGVHKSKEIFPNAWFGDAIYFPFEDGSMPCPHDYDSMLRQIFGDYMQLPPVEERCSDHMMRIVSLGGGNSDNDS